MYEKSKKEKRTLQNELYREVNVLLQIENYFAA